MDPGRLDPMSERILPPAVLALTPGTLHRDGAWGFGDLERRVEAAIDGGLRGVLLREPGLGDRDLLALGRVLRHRLEGVAGWFGIHDAAHLAEELGADGVHLGFRSLPPGEVRPWIPKDCVLGVSCHAGDPPGFTEFCDYAFFGPVHDTPSKHGLQEPVGWEGLAREVRDRDVPIWALGGLDTEAGPRVHESGARGFATLRAILGADDPTSAAGRAVGGWEAAVSCGGEASGSAQSTAPKPRPESLR